MANLIITVISIALVAVAALMGAYYGGNAFLDGQDKAKANKFVQDAQQIDAAITLWKANNGNSLITPNLGNEFNTGFDFLVSQKYLSALPQTSSTDNKNYICSDVPDFTTNGSPCGNFESHWIIQQVDFGWDSNNVSKVCKLVSKMARGDAAKPYDSTYATAQSYEDERPSNLNSTKFDCINGGESDYFLIYKIS